MNNEWVLPSYQTNLSLTEVLEIIDDALCYSFEFKVENHHLYWRTTD